MKINFYKIIRFILYIPFMCIFVCLKGVFFVIYAFWSIILIEDFSEYKQNIIDFWKKDKGF